MKKILLLFISLLLIVYLCVQLPRYRYGYFVKGQSYQREYGDELSAVTLDDGNVLIIGLPYYRKTKDFLGRVSEVKVRQTLLYNIKTNKLEKFELPCNIDYMAKGILLNNNKLLLTDVYDPDSADSSNIFINPYTMMAVVDLKTNKVEKMIKKKICNELIPIPDPIRYVLLDNGKVFIADFDADLGEIYNPSTNTSKLIKLNANKSAGATVVAVNDGKALIFGESEFSYKQHLILSEYAHHKIPEDIEPFNETKDTVLEYDDATETLKPVGTAFRRNSPEVVKVNDDNLLLFVGEINAPGGWNRNVREVELYDIKTNKSKIIGKLKKVRSEMQGEIGASGASINDRYFLIVCGSGHLFGFQSVSEIVDLKEERIIKGPNIPINARFHKMLKLKNGQVLVLNPPALFGLHRLETCLFKPWKGIKHE